MDWNTYVDRLGASDSWKTDCDHRATRDEACFYDVRTTASVLRELFSSSGFCFCFIHTASSSSLANAGSGRRWVPLFPTISTIMLSSSWRIFARSNTSAIATRSLATEAAHKPPIDLHGLHARYANAAYTAASKAGILEKVESEMLAIKNTATTSNVFKTFLENPLVSRDDKEKRVLELLKGQVSPVTLNLMLTLAGNARLSETTKIVDTYSELMKAKRGEVDATIISAEALTKAQMDTVAAAMKSQIGDGKKVILSSKVDPSILGGLQVQIGDKFLDLSVGSRIDAISRIAV